MVRLTADLVQRAPFFMNPLKERELDLRNHHIPAIENLGTTNDSFDAIDLSFNDVPALENFPLLPRLTTLLLGNNRVARIAPAISAQIPNLRLLVLTSNRIESLKEIEGLRGLVRLEQLVLVDNPVVHVPNYRLFVVHTLPRLRILDFRRIRQRERVEAAALFGNARQQKGSAASATAAAPTAETAEAKAKREAAIREAIKNAKTLEDIAGLERVLAASGQLSSDVVAPPGAEKMDMQFCFLSFLFFSFFFKTKKNRYYTCSLHSFFAFHNSDGKWCAKRRVAERRRTAVCDDAGDTAQPRRQLSLAPCRQRRRRDHRRSPRRARGALCGPVSGGVCGDSRLPPHKSALRTAARRQPRAADGGVFVLFDSPPDAGDCA